MNQAEAISFFVGLTARWFRDAFCAEEVRIAAERGADAYDLIEDLAMAVPPGANGIIPVFSDAMDFGNWYHAAPSLLNLSIDPAVANKGSIFRAIQENAAIVAAVNLARVEEFAKVDSTAPLTFAGRRVEGPAVAADRRGCHRATAPHPEGARSNRAWWRGRGGGRHRPVRLSAGSRSGFRKVGPHG